MQEPPRLFSFPGAAGLRKVCDMSYCSSWLPDVVVGGTSSVHSLRFFTQLGWCCARIVVRRRFSASRRATSAFRLAFCTSTISLSATRIVVFSFFLFRHLVAATLFRSRRRRLRSSSSGVRSCNNCFQGLMDTSTMICSYLSFFLYLDVSFVGTSLLWF